MPQNQPMYRHIADDLRSKIASGGLAPNAKLPTEGELSDELGRLFAGMSLRRDHGNTVLMGVVRDQAELHGLLQRFADLGLTILSVVAIDRPPAPLASGLDSHRSSH